MLTDNAELLKTQAQLREVSSAATQPHPPDAAAVAAGGAKLYILGTIDRDAEIVGFLTKHLKPPKPRETDPGKETKAEK